MNEFENKHKDAEYEEKTQTEDEINTLDNR